MNSIKMNGKGLSSTTVQITEEPTPAELGEIGSVQYVTNRQGLKLCRYRWPVQNPVGKIVAIHGFGSHTGNLLLKRKTPGAPLQYEESIAQIFNQRGYSVACMDLQGCGRSDGCRGRRGFFYAFEDLITDLVEFLESLHDYMDGFDVQCPTFLFGVSLGGCLSVHLAHHCQDLIDGVALLAPMLSVEQLARSGINRVYSVIGRWLNLLIPDVPLLKMGKQDKFPEIQEFYEKDPAMFKGRIRVRVGWQCMQAIDWIRRHDQNLTFPFLIVHGTDDTLCDPQVRFVLFTI